VLRTGLHRDGLAHHIVNFEEYPAHTACRLRRQVDIMSDHVLTELLDELTGYPDVAHSTPHDHEIGVVLALRMRSRGHELALLTTIATCGAPVDVTLSELAIEAFDLPTPAQPTSFELPHAARGSRASQGAPSSRAASARSSSGSKSGRSATSFGTKPYPLTSRPTRPPFLSYTGTYRPGFLG